jgi:hypothetical protein
MATSVDLDVNETWTSPASAVVCSYRLDPYRDGVKPSIDCRRFSVSCNRSEL